MKLLLLKYNNYYNRILKGYNNIDGYKLAVGTSGYAEIGGVNFNPRDGINTYHTINTPFEFDYMLVFDDTEPYTIRSRWFVIDSEYENLLQRTVTLRRDVLYDYSGIYGTVPAFIEKGAVASSDSAIYNLENMTFNQILSRTYYLRDTVGKSWYVAYIAKGRTEQYSVPVNHGVGQEISFEIVPGATSCVDAPYDMIVIPPPDYKLIVGDKEYSNQIDSAGSFNPLNIAACMSKSLYSGGVLYDIQRLPYCPFIGDSRFTVGANSMSAPTLKSGFDFDKPSTSSSGLIVYAKFANFSTTINYKYNYDLSTPVNVKIDNETRKLRILSPNSGNMFEFTPAKLGLRDSTSNNIVFNVKCTYKPYSPYIHIYPTFGGLYGTVRTPENRGLICGGDFSLPLLNDAWSSYEIRNKNYMNAFNRQIENMEIQQDYQRTQQALSIATGAIGGAVGGAVLGGGVGGVVGGLASIAGGIADYKMSEKLRTEALDYTKDMFGYSLQNIKALPVGLGRVGSIVIDSFPQPVLEEYSATSEEVAALTDKIKWNGMTVGRIGTFNDFKSRASTSCRYIKAQIIRMADLHEELHTAKAISDELYKGVYIY